MDDYISGWQDWTQAFEDWHDVTISELHGLISGVLSVCDAPTEQQWQLLLTELSFTELEPKALEIVTEEGEDMVAVLTDDADSYQFMPLLPDDDHPLYERLMALKNWANGFLTGFGVTDSALRPEENTLFNDLAKIGALRVDVYDEALQGTDNAEGEVEYMELLEFVRMIPVSVSQGRVRKSVAKLPLIAGFALNRPVGKAQEIDKEHLDFIEQLRDDELDWEAEKDTNDDFVTHMVIDAMTGKKPS
ncbi:hypothetical protein A9299_05995 [Moraxella osloensis]|uniref:Uncharacterized protein n=1 Tax=Faucicola osloensis TaxID=34062 RepID=A0AA91FP81_FAUOS|nr:UPF0149 family protein [Moraxella osloensis]OBX60740.1 hypothetical protein A9299_05995 [Moraxella osloensis]